MRQIDADELKKALWEEYENECENIPYMDNDGRIDLDIVDEIIDNAPTLGKWIPVNKAMPEEYRSTRDIFDIDKRERVKSESDVVIVTALDDDGAPYSGLDYTVNGKFDTSVIAWQPLPEPYEGNIE